MDERENNKERLITTIGTGFSIFNVDIIKSKLIYEIGKGQG